MKLEFKNIFKNYGKTKALIDFNCTLEPGIYALLGPNGSGKSTLMNIITDNLKATSGDIFYDDVNIKELKVKFREKIGFMPQYPGIYPSFSVGDYLGYLSALKGMDKKEAKEKIEAVLAAVDLSDSINTKVRALSGGMKQRLALAGAVLGDPEILILDEPTAGLDPKQRIAVRNYISSIAFHKIVLIATHVVSDVEFIAKDVIILKKGEILTIDSPEKLTESIYGKVYIAHVDENEIENVATHGKVTNIAKDGDKAIVRVISDEDLSSVYEKATPTLEDYYLYVFENESESSDSSDNS